jgi:hypothetical protein
MNKVGFNKTDISHSGPYCTHSYFPEDITYRILFTEMVSISYLRLIKIVRAIFEKVTKFVLGKGKGDI